MEGEYNPLPTTLVEKPEQFNWKAYWMITAILLLVAVITMTVSHEQLKNSCDEQIENATINGTNIGAEAVIYTLTERAVNCEQIPISYQDINYTLYPLECLNLNSTKEVN